MPTPSGARRELLNCKALVLNAAEKIIFLSYPGRLNLKTDRSTLIGNEAPVGSTCRFGMPGKNL